MTLNLTPQSHVNENAITQVSKSKTFLEGIPLSKNLPAIIGRIPKQALLMIEQAGKCKTERLWKVVNRPTSSKLTTTLGFPCLVEKQQLQLQRGESVTSIRRKISRHANTYMLILTMTKCPNLNAQKIKYFSILKFQQLYYVKSSRRLQPHHRKTSPPYSIHLGKKFLFQVIQKSKVRNLGYKWVCQYCKYYLKFRPFQG